MLPTDTAGRESDFQQTATIAAIAPSWIPGARPLSALLAQLDPLPLECDGMTRVLSTLLARDGIAHQVQIGALHVDDIGVIPHHWWLELRGGTVCDLRAQMWLGLNDAVPHGQFQPDARHHYKPQRSLRPLVLQPSLFHLLTGASLESFPKFLQGVA